MRRGTVVIEEFESRALAGNPCGDPHVRRVPVYLPPSYAGQIVPRYPVIYVLTGFTGRGRMLLNDVAWGESLDQRLDRLIDQGMGEAIVVMPDCFTRFGGSQYLDSSATGAYETHLVDELVPFIDGKYRTKAAAGHRGIAGKSSGGYGAIVQAMKHPDVFGAVACHSGDMYFEFCYRPDIAKTAAVTDRAGGVVPWFEGFLASKQKSNKDDHVAINILAMAASYSPNPAASATYGIDLPWDAATGRFRQDVWDRWVQHDPLVMLESHADALRAMKLVFLDCGVRDEWNLHLGARMFARRLTELGIAHEHEEFDDGHMNVQYRYDVSLPKLAKALGATSTAKG